MLESIFGLSANANLIDLGVLVTLTSIIVEVLKKVLPKKIPTQLLTVIISILLSVIVSLLCFGVAFKALAVGVITGFIVSFTAMNGFDSLKSILTKCQNLKEKIDNDTGGES